ncbi:permease [uncultured Paenibacillus sp.]|uniref:permease n=1 Tax=uncultured Paenibacillus sp. TaxID=227322 RepID=UPI0015ADE961|nr:permease [uncultured Paenibacillus sp.]GJM78765.1 membrane protein [Paenibacillus sp. HMSSN-139]
MVSSSTSGHYPQQPPHGFNKRKTALFIVLFLIIAIAGLSYVKWWPYYGKAFKAATEHSIGSSILGADASGPISWSAALDYAAAYFKSVWKAAVLGILLGSLVQVLLPAQWLHKVLGSSRFKSTFLGGIVSLPGMMCTCCAAPIAAGLRKRNVSVGASLAFWLGNPVLNPATLIFMTFVLSWKFTLLRLVFGIVLTFGVSYFANRLAKGQQVPAPAEMERAEAAAELKDEGPFALRWLKSLGMMILNVVPAYLLSVLLLGAFQGVLFPVELGGGILTILLFALVGTLFVIPTAAEIPIIQSFTALGLGAGPAAALLLTLPAISLPSLLMVSRSFPRKVLGFVFASVVVLGIVAGVVGAWVL